MILPLIVSGTMVYHTLNIHKVSMLCKFTLSGALIFIKFGLNTGRMTYHKFYYTEAYLLFVSLATELYHITVRLYV